MYRIISLCMIMVSFISMAALPSHHRNYLVLADGAGRNAGLNRPRPQANQAARSTVSDAYGKLPLSFEANHGQVDSRVKFLSRGSGYTLFLTANEAVLQLQNKNPQSAIRNPQSTTLRMKLAGANPAPQVAGHDELPGRSNYFIGNDPKKWRAGVRNYAKVEYKAVYPGVDMVYYGNQRQLEYDFVVAPGSDPKSITLAFEGADQPAIDAQGDLVLRTAAGEVRQRKPFAYQEINGRREEVAACYVMKSARRIGFEVGWYDADKPLVIDPVLIYSTFLGATGQEECFAIAVDAADNAYVTGWTTSIDFPITPGAFQSTHAGGSFDIFITKLNAAGNALVYSTYLGGTGTSNESSTDITIDAAGNAYVTGYTHSTDFPTTPGAFRVAPEPSLLGFPPLNLEGFVTKLNPTGTALVYSTLIGGNSSDNIAEIAVDSTGNAYLAGGTSSTNFPITAGAFRTTYLGPTEAFVMKLNAAGSQPVYSTFLGGSRGEGIEGIALDAAGNAYVTGFTLSDDFPTTPGAFRTTRDGFTSFNDAFVAKLNATGTGLIYSTFFGGTRGSQGTDITVDTAGNVYVAGITLSPDFPTTPGAFQTTFIGGPPFVYDSFVTKLNTAGSALVYSTFLGGSNNDFLSNIALSPSGSLYVTGSTDSTDYPVTSNALTPTLTGPEDGVLTQLSTDGTRLIFSTFIGGSNRDRSSDVAVDTSGNVYAAGGTISPDFPTTPGAFQPIYQGGAFGDGFILKISGPPPFDICLQDDSNGNILQFNSSTGAYQMTNCNGFTLEGTGMVGGRGCTITLQDTRADRRLAASIDTCAKKGTVSLRSFSQGRTFTVLDRNITDNSCACR